MGISLTMTRLAALLLSFHHHLSVVLQCYLPLAQADDILNKSEAV